MNRLANPIFENGWDDWSLRLSYLTSAATGERGIITNRPDRFGFMPTAGNAYMLLSETINIQSSDYPNSVEFDLDTVKQYEFSEGDFFSFDLCYYLDTNNSAGEFRVRLNMAGGLFTYYVPMTKGFHKQTILTRAFTATSTFNIDFNIKILGAGLGDIYMKHLAVDNFRIHKGLHENLIDDAADDSGVT